MKNVYHLYDGEYWYIVPSEHEAQRLCENALENTKTFGKDYDGSWPESIQEIAVYYGPEDTEYPDECEQIFKIEQFDVRRPVLPLDDFGYDQNGDYWSSESDYFCDYRVVRA